MWKFDTSFDFSYGHRIWNQETNLQNCDCRLLHGHQGKVCIHLETDVLNEGKIINCDRINDIELFINKHINNKFLIHFQDPIFLQMINANPIANDEDDERGKFDSKMLNDIVYADPIKINDVIFGYEFNFDGELTPEQELYKSFVILNCNPTAENLSRWMFLIVEEIVKDCVNLSHVDWYETSKSKSTFFK